MVIEFVNGGRAVRRYSSGGVNMGTGVINRHFTVSRFVFIIALIAAGASFVGAAPISDISVQTVEGWLSSPPYGWTYSFDIGFSDLEVGVEIRIGLEGDEPGAELLTVWENGIEDMWNRQFDIIDAWGEVSDPYHYHVNFDVVFPEDPLASVHHAVHVTDGIGRGNMLSWYTTSDWGSEYNGAAAAHEVGHMFSLFDEYKGGAKDPNDPIEDPTSIMGSLDGVAKERHYEPFLDWLQVMAPERELLIGEYDPTWVIPEPATIVILGLGVLFTIRKRPGH